MHLTAIVQNTTHEQTHTIQAQTILSNNHVLYISTKTCDYNDSYLIAGELLAIVQAIDYAGKNQYTQLTIKHHYSGAEHWVTNNWTPKRKTPIWYKTTVQQLITQYQIQVAFERI